MNAIWLASVEASSPRRAAEPARLNSVCAMLEPHASIDIVWGVLVLSFACQSSENCSTLVVECGCVLGLALNTCLFMDRLEHTPYHIYRYACMAMLVQRLEDRVQSGAVLKQKKNRYLQKPPARS